MTVMSKALARRPKHSRAATRYRGARDNPMSPLMTGIVWVLLGGIAGAIYGGLQTGTGGIFGGVEQGAALVGIGGLITGLLSPEMRDGAFAVGGVGLLTELVLGIGQGVYTYFQPKAA
jgi:hypothetical protein